MTTNQQSIQADGHNHANEHDHGHSHGSISGCGVPTFNTRDLIVKEDIMAKAKELAQMLFQSEEIQHYQRAEKQIQDHERVQGLISQMKKKQKEIVAFQSFNNPSMVTKIEGEIEALQDELDGIPIVTEFQQSQTDINYLLQLVISVIRDTVAEKINVEDAAENEPEECIE
ncbi:RicAFT regulatory complex protein RicA family protein [Paenibacillus sp. GCM10012307]|uniref:RicAFT regulatory complex protein RicA family protein n=1 Tax=Paenibacillus roseus TaxID=2798579 RepID=A0A934J727_9BACL|nr:YlbF family regulator [Paenibacillus roseus]MBJ6364110.1 RicAFT regulatory complex protein RicA family protein [Paenibacillus roseus]